MTVSVTKGFKVDRNVILAQGTIDKYTFYYFNNIPVGGNLVALVLVDKDNENDPYIIGFGSDYNDVRLLSDLNIDSGSIKYEIENGSVKISVTIGFDAITFGYNSNKSTFFNINFDNVVDSDVIDPIHPDHGENFCEYITYTMNLKTVLFNFKLLPFFE